MIIIIMGVTGAGKTTVGSLLARELNWKFEDADDFHSDVSKNKIRQGISLSDADRTPWLSAIRTAMLTWVSRPENVVLACSALKRSYREHLQIGPEVKFVYLKGTYEVIDERLRLRLEHFAGESILKGQFDTLEEPDNAVTISVDQSPADMVREIQTHLRFTQK